MASTLSNTFHSLYTQVSTAYERGDLLSSAINTAKELDTQTITVIALTALTFSYATYKMSATNKLQAAYIRDLGQRHDSLIDQQQATDRNRATFGMLGAAASGITTVFNPLLGGMGMASTAIITSLWGSGSSCNFTPRESEVTAYLQKYTSYSRADAFKNVKRLNEIYFYLSDRAA